ncbi:MAG: hypothetical protein K0R67_3818, partial [Paenibacillus sp.]|nr:hypothetical protein [Paenibacillus sp.]
PIFEIKYEMFEDDVNEIKTIDVYNALKLHDYVALKYVENPWAWLVWWRVWLKAR